MTTKSVSMRLCDVDGCPKKHEARGYCKMHYRRWGIYGDPLQVKFAVTQGKPEKRFWAKVLITPFCWYWEAYKDSNGYGHFSDIPGNRKLAHRLSYEYLVGELAEGVVLDHKCRTPSCVNPDHLTATTPQGNSENLGVNKRSGFRGVYRYAKGKNKSYWVGYVRHKNVRHYLGYFPMYELHIAAYKTRELRNTLMTNNVLDR